MTLSDPTSDQLTILTDNQRLEGWLSSRVTRGVELLPSFFDLSITERFPTSIHQSSVTPGKQCQVFLGSDLIITGFIDQYSPTYDSRTHYVRIAGRTITQDVVDSAYIGPPWEISAGGSLQQTVNDILSRNFSHTGIKLKMIGGDAKIPDTRSISITPGETAYQIIEELCRMTSRLLWDDQDGNLVISKVGTERAGSSLVEGENVEAAAVMMDWSQRYNRIEIRGTGTAYGVGTDENRQAEGTATDNEIRVDRRKFIIINGWFGKDNELAQQRAEWEINRRKGRALLVKVHVVGWRDGGGKLWTPNTVVHASLPTLKVENDLVIAQCEWTRDNEGGTKTILTLMPAGGLTPEPFIGGFGIGQGPA